MSLTLEASIRNRWEIKVRRLYFNWWTWIFIRIPKFVSPNRDNRTDRHVHCTQLNLSKLSLWFHKKCYTAMRSVNWTIKTCTCTRTHAHKLDLYKTSRIESSDGCFYKNITKRKKKKEKKKKNPICCMTTFPSKINTNCNDRMSISIRDMKDVNYLSCYYLANRVAYNFTG